MRRVGVGMKYTAHSLAALALASSLLPISIPADSPSNTAWEYKVVGIAGLHGSTLDYLKEALKGDEGLLDKALATDEQLARKTEDLLDGFGAEGWDLVHITSTQMILKRQD